MALQVDVSENQVTIFDETFGENQITGSLVFDGSALELLPDGETISGPFTGYTLTFSYNDPALGLAPMEVFQGIGLTSVFEPTDIVFAWTGIVFLYALALQDLDLADQSDLGKVYELGANAGSFTSLAGADHVTATDFGGSIATRGGDDYIRGTAQSGDLFINAGGGDDRVFGGAGNERVIGNSGNDYLDGGVGNDRLFGGTGDDELLAGEGRDNLSGEGRDNLSGGAGNDLLRAADGNDRLVGGAGRDVLIAESGFDRLIGGADADAFVFFANGTGGTPSAGRTLILDFDLTEDILWLGPSSNGTWDQQDAFDIFMVGARQSGNNIVFTEGDYQVVVKNVDLDDLTLVHFADGAAGLSYSDWIG